MKFYVFLTILLTISSQSDAALNFTIIDGLTSIAQIAEGIIDSAPGSLPADYVFEIINNLVSGLPPQIAYSTANSLCSTVIAAGKDQTPEKYAPKLEDIKLQFRTTCDKREYPIANLSGLISDPDFDINKKTVIFSTGWTVVVNNERNDALAKAYNCRGDTNFLALDVGDYINTLYSWSAQNTDAIGKFLALGIQNLESIIDLDDLHIMGHSLGAQIMSSAARTYRNLTGKSLPYVTGLDPAFPCFNEGQKLTTISSSDADFVDIIHTNPGVSGQPESNGDVDFYVGGKFPIQAPCQDVQCSHEIVWQYYTESIYPNNENDFLAKRCGSLYNLEQGKCTGKESPMGYAVPHNLRGNYVLEVNSEKPYGKNATADYTNPDDSDCGKCQD